jgi:cell division protease FtsH
MLLKRETIEAEEFVALLNGTPEGEIWPELPEGPERPELPTATRERESAKRTIPRPGLAGGTAELRRDFPEKPELA